MRPTPSPVLRRLFLGSLRRRRLATALSLLAIALGVTLGLAVQLIHAAAIEEFDRGVRLVTGVADLQAVGPRMGFDEALYPRLARRPEIDSASPVLEVQAQLPEHQRRLRLLGVDVFRVGAVTPGLLPVPEAEADPGPETGAGRDTADVAGAAQAADAGSADAAADRFAILREDVVFLSPAALNRLGLSVGDRLQVQAGTQTLGLRVAGRVPGAGLDQELAVMDIAAAQQAFDRLGRLTRVDLRLVAGMDPKRARDALQGQMPAGIVLRTPEESADEVLGLSRAYRVNLTMLAAIALLTGGFLVFSTQLLAVVRRRREFAFLRALGLGRRRLLGGLLAEGAVLGLVGGLLGILLSYLLAALAMGFLGGDLGAGFFQGLQPQLRAQPVVTLIYLGLAVLAGVAGAWLPAREAARMLPAHGLRSGDESEVFRGRPRWGLAGLVLAAALVSALLPSVGGIPVFGYAAVALVLVGAVLVLPGVTPWGLRLLPVHRPLPRLARARLSAAPGQVAVAGAGVVASVALAVSMAIMVSSFRVSLDDWLGRMLPADLYLRAAESDASGYLEPAAVAAVEALPGVIRVRPVRFDTVRITGVDGPVALIARPVAGTSGLPLVAGGPPSASTSRLETSRDAAAEGRPVWLSEALADRLQLGIGDALSLPLGGRAHGFRVQGVWRDYARQQGAAVIELSDYRALSGDQRTNDVGIFLAPSAQPEQVMAQIREALDGGFSEMIQPGALRAIILQVFDRTFLVTYLMEAVAVLIGLFGISTTYAALADSRRKEFGILRHLGLRRREIGNLLAMEAALSAAIGVLVGLAAGGAIALVLVEVINWQSFGWSMDIRLPVGVLAGFSLAMVLLAAVAARLSGYQAMRQDAVLAVREDW